MIGVVADPVPEVLGGFSAIIDVRSPSEFAEDRIPGAVNLPVLDDAERARVGTIYVQESRFEARRLGAALVARNIARHLEGPLANETGAFAPLIYCWRGGQRSNAMATILDQVGWRVSVVQGGYRTWRRRVMRALYEDGPQPRVVLLDGQTGTAKTEILGRLAARGVQVIDLEGLAAHRGSLFGALPEHPQPPQKLFESRLWTAMRALDPQRPVVVEAESSKVGELNVPPVLWRAMSAAPRIVLVAPVAERAAYLTRAYRDVAQDPARLEATLERLPPHHGREVRSRWRELAAAGDHPTLARSLIEAHYDPGYLRSARRETRRILGEIALADLGAASQEAAVDQISSLVERESGCPA